MIIILVICGLGFLAAGQAIPSVQAVLALG